ncbi:MAG: shikimate dehydrogenase [Thermodesulfobacteriota bacterium]|nr:shikimate dehydrogenase [Thermodesulfobacteriota bacterium]
MVDGTTSLVGIIGHPVRQSRSPQIHNSAFLDLKMNWIYVPMEVSPRALSTALEGLKALGFKGANVTVPFKEDVLSLVDSLSEEAACIGAVNTLSIVQGRLRGDNTDWLGFLHDLKERSISTGGKKALVLGTGGVARAVVYALLKAEAFVLIYGRDRPKAEALANHFGGRFPESSIESASWDHVKGFGADIDILINCTSLGMPPYADMSPWPQDVRLPRCELIYDVVYSPPSTRFLECARNKGIQAVNGLGMLVYQAAESLSLWTGVEAPLKIMRKAALSC